MPDGGRFTDAPIGNRGIARKENEHMSNTGADAANAQRESRRLADMHDLCLTSLLFDLVEAHGRVKTAKALGVS